MSDGFRKWVLYFWFRWLLVYFSVDDDQVCVYVFVGLRSEWKSVDIDDIATLVRLTRGSETRRVIGFGSYDDCLQLLGIRVVEFVVAADV